MIIDLSTDNEFKESSWLQALALRGLLFTELQFNKEPYGHNTLTNPIGLNISFIYMENKIFLIVL